MEKDPGEVGHQPDTEPGIGQSGKHIDTYGYPEIEITPARWWTKEFAKAGALLTRAIAE
jgi:hypothetical protein